MKLLFACLCVLGLAPALVATEAAAQTPPITVSGVWNGTLLPGGASLRLVITLAQAASGVLTGNLESLDQHSTIPIGSGIIENDRVRLQFPVANASFDGRLSADRSQIEGTWTQGGGSLPLVLKRGAIAATVQRRPQTPVPPYPYAEESVTYQNPVSGLALAGSLTLPRGSAKSPAVILISGSGAQDRDETLFGHKPFLVLADHLTRAGIAVLRVDDRGVGGSGGRLEDATGEDLAGDVIAGIAYLKGRPEIDTAHIGLIGHSEGGEIAPLAATRSKDVAFIVLLAGPGVPGEEILYLQAAALGHARGATEAQIAGNRSMQEAIFGILKSEPDLAAARKRLNDWRDGVVSTVPPAQQPAVAAQLNAQITQVASPWFRYLLTYDPRPTLAKVQVPVLALNGERDLQVPYRENLSAIETALKSRGNRDVTIVHLPSLNHLFQTAATGLPAEYPQIEETLAPSVLKLVTEWVQRHTH